MCPQKSTASAQSEENTERALSALRREVLGLHLQKKVILFWWTPALQAPWIAVPRLEQGGLCDILPIPVPALPVVKACCRAQGPEALVYAMCQILFHFTASKKYIVVFLSHEASVGCRVNLSPGCCVSQCQAIRKHSSIPRDNNGARGSLVAFQDLLHDSEILVTDLLLVLERGE